MRRKPPPQPNVKVSERETGWNCPRKIVLAVHSEGTGGGDRLRAERSARGYCDNPGGLAREKATSPGMSDRTGCPPRGSESHQY